MIARTLVRCGSRTVHWRRLARARTTFDSGQALNVLGYNLTRVISIVGVKPLLAAMRA